MKNNLNGKPSRELILHPFNIILLFMINTSLINLKAGLPIIFSEAALSFIIIAIFSLLLYFLINLLTKNHIKTAIILSTILFVTLYFRDIHELLVILNITETLNFFPEIMGELIFIILLMIILLAALVTLLYKTKRNLSKFNSYLNVLTIIFILYEVFNCFSFTESKVELSEKIILNSSGKKQQQKHDIYYIILDEYTGFTGLKKFWKYDNKELKDFLINYDFFVAEKGRANYTNTNYSIASSLNMCGLKYKSENVYALSNYLSLARHIKENPVVKYFYDNDYELVNMSFFEFNNKERFYNDIYYLKKGNIYQARTIYGHLYEILNEKFADMANINVDIFKKIKKIRSKESKKPKFIYAHIMMPHPPFYFDANGNKTSRTHASDKTNMNNYLEQLKYTNKLLMKSINGILNVPGEKPIIIIQGDHGYRSYNGKDKMEMEYSILNSIYFPDKDYSMLNDSLKAVNTFRIIFNKYFGEKFELLN